MVKGARFLGCATAALLAGVLMAPHIASAATSAGAPLADAEARQEKATVSALLQQKADVNAAQPDGATALHWASHWDDLATADLLIRAGANVNAKNDYGATPLSLACMNGNSAMVEKIIDRSINSLAANGVEIHRDHWMKEAVDSEKAEAVLTCQAIIKSVIGYGVEDQDRKHTWLEDAEHFTSQVETVFNFTSVIFIIFFFPFTFFNRPRLNALGPFMLRL